MIKIITIKDNGQIDLTVSDIEKMLNEAYDLGYSEGMKKNYTWCYTTPYKYNFDLCNQENPIVTDKKITITTDTKTGE